MSKITINPSLWASLIPNGLGEVKPHHILEMFKTIGDNRDELQYAWKILNEGVCDGCALGTTGMRDFTIDGIHLCTVRLNLLRLNTMPAMDEKHLEDVTSLQQKSSKELRMLGRLPYPMIRYKGEKGSKRISWEQALHTLARSIKRVDPKRWALYLTSRGIMNETYYVAQKVARFLGTNHVDNAARICHSPSTVALKQSLGISASSCSYKDWIGTDLLIFLGSNVPNNQPVTTKYLYHAKQAGTRIVVINPYKEPGLERYWVPSVFESALFGTKLADDFFSVHTGGDLAFLNAVLKRLIEQNQVDETFIQQHTEGWPTLKAAIKNQSWEELERLSGATRESIEAFADIYAKAKSAVFVWSMGITQHAHGVDNVQAIINLALSRGMLGREHCGLMPIRGHSGVQGGGEMGCAPNVLPGGIALNEKNCQDFEARWGFPIPRWEGMMAADMIDACDAGDLDILYSIGGNFLETLPDPDYVEGALARVPLRVHQDIVLTSQMLVAPHECVLLLPSQTRYEHVGGGTETTTERQVVFSPEVKGRRIGEARAEWEVLMELAQRVKPEAANQIHFENTAAIRREIASANPLYTGIEKLAKQGDHFQWGGRWLCPDGACPTPDGKAHFHAVRPLENSIPAGYFAVSSRRGKQFNSMVHQAYDPLTGAWRDAVFMSPEDAQEQGLSEGDQVLLRSEVGQMQGRIKIVPIKPRNLQVHWPEGNPLLRREKRSPESGVPDYNAWVEVIPLAVAAAP